MHSLSARQAPHLPTLPLGVVVHVLVFGLQLFLSPLQAFSFDTVHSTHWLGCPVALEWQRDFPEICVQSLSVAHGAHVLVVGSQRDIAAFVQSVFAKHATHCFFSLLQNGAAGVFWQSMFSRHATQVFTVGEPGVVSHAGLPATPAQSVAARHCTHVFAVVRQTFLEGSLQSPLTRHSTQADVFVSQTLLGSVVQSALAAHVTQVFFEVSHTGVAPEQCASFVHATQVFVVVLQPGYVPLQCVSAVHVTHA